MKTIRRLIGIGLVIAAVFALGQAIATASAPAKRQRLNQTLRTSDPQLRQTIEQGLARSWTLRQLEAHLERSSVVVYLARASLTRGIVGRTRLIGSGDGWRFLSIEFDPRIDGLNLLTVIGHELQHAVEIADASGVVDEESMLELYRRIGVRSSENDLLTHAFETQQAVETGRRVHTELIGLL